MGKDLVASVLLVVMALSASAQQTTMPLSKMSLWSALEQLRNDGHEIVFSSALVQPEMTIEVTTLSIDTLREYLPRLGLELKPSGRRWLVVKQPQVASPPNGPVRTRESRVPTFRPQLEEIIVTGTRHRLPDGIVAGSAMRLSAKELSLAPALGGDTMRATVRMPGVSSVGVSAKPQIRGGAQDELLVMLDGVELLDPFHLADFQSVFSAVDDHTVDTVDFYTGGFPARYGNRMSGVMDISTLRQTDKPRTVIGLSSLSTLVNLRGAPSDDIQPWLVSLRRGNLDFVIDQVDKTLGKPKFVDGHVRIGTRVNEDVALYAGTFLSRDDVALAVQEDEAQSQIDTGYLWTRLDVDHSVSLRSTTVLTFTWSDRKKREWTPDDVGGIERQLDYRQQLEKIGVRSDFSLSLGAHLMEFGLQAEHGRSAYDSTAFTDRSELSALFGTPEADNHDIHTNPDGTSSGVYWSGEFMVGDRLMLQPGLRWDFQDYYDDGSADQVSPRLGVRYELSDAALLRLDLGRFYQPEGLHEMQVADGVDRYTEPQRVDHSIIGAEWTPNDAWALRGDLYQKRYSHTTLRFENLFNPFVLHPEIEPDRVPIAPSSARAAGVDLEARREISERLATGIRYSYMDADDRINGHWVPRRWSQRHTLNAFAAWHTDAFDFSVAITWHSGWRTTAPPPSLPADVQLPLDTLLNNRLLDDYVSLDVKASKSWPMGRSTLTVFADVTNITNHDNVAGIDYDVEEVGDEFFFTPDQEALLPIIPSIGLLLSF